MSDTPAVKLTPLDRAIAAVAPTWGLRRAHARQVLALYEAAKPNRQRSQRRDAGSANSAIRAAGSNLRALARHLEQNNPHARAVLRVLTNNTVGTGIGVEPSPRRADGSIHDPFARTLADAWERWSRWPEVTRRMHLAEACRVSMRTAIRDGEVLVRLIEGQGANYRHATAVPLSVQFLEPDHLPLGWDGVHRIPAAPGQPESGPWPIYDAMEFNGWGECRAYWMYDQHPGEVAQLLTASALRRVPAAQVLHLAMTDRLHQRRGVTLFPSVLETFDDLADYEESERVAAKVAASMAAAIVKGSPDLYNPAGGAPINEADGATTPRELRFRAGMIFDDLRPGESVEMIGSNGRPNPALVDFRFAMLRAISAATGCSFSSIAKKYGETYSGQRQELVESWIDYAVLSSLLIEQVLRPIYERWVNAALVSGALVVPPDVRPETVGDALMIPPSMPWIDPQKEATAWTTLEQAGHASGPEIIRRRGQSPSAVRDAEIAWRKSWREQGEQITADPASADITTVPDAPPAPPDPNPDQPTEQTP